VVPVAVTCNPRTRRLRKEDGEFEASMGYIVKLYLFFKKQNNQNKTKQKYF
jgi:hypothetical protein